MGAITAPNGSQFIGQVVIEPFDSSEGKMTVPAGPDGHFIARGFAPGRYRVTGIPPTVSDLRWLAPAQTTFVEIAPTTREARVEFAWASTGMISVFSRDPRFVGAPPRGRLTDEQARLASRCRLTIVDAAGGSVVERNGFGTDDASVRLEAVVPPGAYVVRFAVPTSRRRSDAWTSRRAGERRSRWEVRDLSKADPLHAREGGI